MGCVFVFAVVTFRVSHVNEVRSGIKESMTKNYSLTGKTGSRAIVSQVTYDAASHTAYLQINGLLPDQYTLTVSQDIKSAAGLTLAAPWTSTFTAVTDFSAYVSLNF